MPSFLSKIKNMISLARVVKVSNDTEQFPSCQISYLGKIADVTRLNPYPIISNPPSNALAIKLNIGAMEENRVAIFHDPKGRLEGLAPGEGGIYNSLTKSYVLLEGDSSVRVVSLGDLIEAITKDVIQTIGGDLSVSVNGGIDQTSLGDHTIKAQNVTIEAPTQITDAFACNGEAPQTKATLGPVAVNLVTAITLVNNIRTALINNGIGEA